MPEADTAFTWCTLRRALQFSCLPGLSHNKHQLLFAKQQLHAMVCRIDEIHMLVGGGSVRSGGLDIANLMKPALARGQVQCIGATTLLEHRKYFERDAAMDRRFQPVMVQEPSQQEALVILEGLKVVVNHESCSLCCGTCCAFIFSTQY